MKYLACIKYRLHLNRGQLLGLILKEADSYDGTKSCVQNKYLHSRVKFFKNNFQDEAIKSKYPTPVKFQQDLAIPSMNAKKKELI